jgi:hypothetical protein
VLGNHKPYGTTLERAIQKFEDYEKDIERRYGQKRFYFLNRRGVDLNEKVTVLGCTLWTHIPASAALACTTLLTDFNEEKGIWERSVEEHNTDHARDLAWLNDTISQISQYEPQRKIIILTHHSPTTDARANDPRHARSSTNNGFRTDLSREVCWTLLQVKMWAFGHTHYNCQFYDHDMESGRLMLVVANQKGYASPGGKTGEVDAVVVEAGGDEWRVVIGAKESKKQESKPEKRMTHSTAHLKDIGRAPERDRGAVPVDNVLEQREQLVTQSTPTVKAPAWRSAGANIKKLLRPN